jgi:hypothetical protein
MPLWRKLLYGFILTNLIAMAIVTFVLPGIIQNKAVEWVASNTDRTLTIAHLRLNPLNWQISIEGLVLTEPGSDQSFVSFKQLSFHISPRSVWEWAPVVTGLELDSPKVALVRMLDGSFNYADLMIDEAQSVEIKSPGEAATEPPRFALNNLVIRDGEFSFTDRSKPEVIHTIREFELALPFLGNTPALADRFVKPHLSMRIDDAPIVATGEVKPFAKSLDTSLELALNNIDLPFYAVYLPHVRRFKIESGHLSLDLKLAYRVRDDEVPELTLNGTVVLSALRVRDQRDRDLFFLPLARVTIERAALFSKEIEISTIDIYDLELFIDRGRDGIWNHTRLANDPIFKTSPSDERGDLDVPQSRAGSSPQVTVDSLRLRDGKVHFLDQAMNGSFKKEIHTINLDLDTVSLKPGNISPFKLSLVTEGGSAKRNGQLQIAGEIALQPFSLSAHLESHNLQLAGLEPYLPPTLSAYFASGHIDSELDLQLQTVAGSPVINVTGEVGVRALRLREPVLQSDILAWENLQLSGLQLEIASGPIALHLNEVVLNNFIAKVLVTRDGQVNLQHAVSQDAIPADNLEVKKGSEVEPDLVQVENTPESSPAPMISIDTIILQDGTFSFFDEHMKKSFRSELTQLGGRISGLNSVSGIPADIDLRGSLNNVSPLKITGDLNPFGDGLYADFKIRFDAIDLTQVTPYSGTYLGYTIEKGKLYLDLDYKIDGAQLNAGNNVFLDQFTFGDKVESDKATGLPVKLAVALLKDRKGEIKLDLPVSGSLDDPQFSIVGVTFTIIKNLLVKAITSPFALLSALIGGGEDFSAVYFELGSAELSQAEQGKLTKLVEALQERPGLRVEVSGYIDAENDPEGYRRVELERKIHELSGKPIDALLSDRDRSRALNKVYRRASFPKPRNVFGMVKGLPDAEMEKLILANSPAGEDAMQALAEQRAKRVVDHLIQIQGLPPERVFLKRDDIYKQGDAAAGRLARAGFGVGVD